MAETRRYKGLTLRFLQTALRVRPIYILADLLSSFRFVVAGESMEPTLASNQYLLISRLHYLVGNTHRGDLIVLHHPLHPKRDFVKRIIGLPGEHLNIKGGQVFINGNLLREPYLKKEGSYPDPTPSQWLLGEEEHFVMGDNRADSQDSRAFGPIDRNLIVGRAWLCYWPAHSWGLIRSLS